MPPIPPRPGSHLIVRELHYPHRCEYLAYADESILGGQPHYANRGSLLKQLGINITTDNALLLPRAEAVYQCNHFGTSTLVSRLVISRHQLHRNSLLATFNPCFCTLIPLRRLLVW